MMLENWLLAYQNLAISVHASYGTNNAVMAVDVEALLTLTY